MYPSAPTIPMPPAYQSSPVPSVPDLSPTLELESTTNASVTIQSFQPVVVTSASPTAPLTYQWRFPDTNSPAVRNVNGFGPVIERTITWGEVGPDGLVFVNLEKNEAMQPPFSVPVNWSDPSIFQRSRRLDEWIEASGVDVALHLADINWGFVPVGTQLITHEDYMHSEDFINGTPVDKARKLLTDPNVRNGHYASLGTHVSAYPVSAGYIFKTRRGTCGLLQITGFTNGTPSVRLRYRLAPNDGAVVSAASSANVDADLKVRLSVAERIIAFSERDTALAAIARDAAKAGNAARAKQAVGRITTFSARDQAALTAARELLKNGQRAEALEIAQTITSFSQRDAALKELVK